MTKCACGKPAEEGRDECFRCRVSSVGFNWRGGALLGKGGFHTTRAEYIKRNHGVDSERELAKRPNIERAEA